MRSINILNNIFKDRCISNTQSYYFSRIMNVKKLNIRHMREKENYEMIDFYHCVINIHGSVFFKCHMTHIML